MDSNSILYILQNNDNVSPYRLSYLPYFLDIFMNRS